MSTRTSPKQARKHQVVAIAYEGLCIFEFGCVQEMFNLPRPEFGEDWYVFSNYAIDPQPLSIKAGGSISVVSTIALDSANTIIIPGWRGATEPVPESLCRDLRAAFARGARICSICSGVFVLAAAGLLDGLIVTTHWSYAETLAALYPNIRVQSHALYIDSGQIVTAAGSAAGLDMMLHLVREDYGVQKAHAVAQRLLLPAQRAGGQKQRPPTIIVPDETDVITALLEWMGARLAQDLSLADLAVQARMTPRTLQRHFVAATHVSPTVWLTTQRVNYAKNLLGLRHNSLARVARSSGFKSEASLRQQFQKILGMSPNQFRAQAGIL